MCGKCHLFGHGQVECNDMNAINILQMSYNDVLNSRCMVDNCKSPYTHITQGHCCNLCGKHSRHIKNCPNNPNFNDSLTTQVGTIGMVNPLDSIKTLQLGHYTTVFDNMGCNWYVRNNNGKLETLFMHSDNWGQYGEDTSHVPIYIAFKTGYIESNN
jgi:hypothetical protein